MDKISGNCLKSRQMWIISFFIENIERNAKEISLPFESGSGSFDLWDERFDGMMENKAGIIQHDNQKEII